MVASVTDNQVLDMLWHRHYAATNPHVNPVFDYISARRQLEFIKSLVRGNSTWMEIVTTSADAKHTIRSGKLAVVLAVEMDQLRIEQILSLKESHDVDFLRNEEPIYLEFSPAEPQLTRLISGPEPVGEGEE